MTTSAGQFSRHKSAPAASLIVAATAWGIGSIFIRNSHVSGLTTSAWRLVISIPVMMGLAKFAGQPVTKKSVMTMAPCGVLFGLNSVLGFTALKTTTVAASSMLGSIYPVFLVILAVPLLHEKITRRQLLLSMAVLFGVGVIVLGADATHAIHKSGQVQHSLRGDLYAFCASCIWAVYFVKTKRIRGLGMQPLTMFSSVMISASITVLPIAAIFAKDFTHYGTIGWGWLLAMVFIPGAIGHGLLNWAHKYVNASLSSVLLQLNTVVAILVGWLKFGENLNVKQWLAVGLVISCLIALALAHSQAPIDAEAALDHA